MKRFSNLFLSISILCLSFTSFATKWYVDDNSNTGDLYTKTSIAGSDSNLGTSASPFVTVQKAINSASAGDTIYVDRVNFVKIDGNRSLNVNKSVTIIGAGTGNTIFSSHSDHRFATIAANNVTIKNLQILDFFLASGNGQALLVNANVTGFVLENVVMSDNFGSGSTGESIYLSSGSSSTFRGLLFSCSGFNGGSGGAIKVNNATLVMDHSLIKQTKDFDGYGGALEMFGADPSVTITNCTFDQCSAYRGGAISQSSGDLNVSGTCFSNNHIEGDGSTNTYGGANYFCNTDDPGDSGIFSNCTFTGAYFCAGTLPSGSDCQFSTNSSNDGKSIAFRSAKGVFSFTTCTFNNANVNATFDSGQEFYLNKGGAISLTLNNCTFGGDQNGSASGGNNGAKGINIYNLNFAAADLTITNCGTVQTTANQDNIVGNNVSISGTLPAVTNNNLPTGTASTNCLDPTMLADCAASVNCATENKSPLILQCVANKSFAGTCSSTMPDYTAEVSAYDDCSFTVTQSPAPGTAVSPGTTYTVTMTVSDQSPNSLDATCTFTVAVTGSSITAPIVGSITQPTCPTPTGSVDLSGLPSSGTWTVTASPGALTKTGTGTTTTFTGLTANTTYTFTVTDGVSGCTSPASSSAIIDIAPTPNAGILSAVDATLCSGTTTTVSSTVAGGTWSTSDAGIATVDVNTGLVTAISGGTAVMTYTVAGTGGCLGTNATATINIDVTSAPITGVLSAVDATLCSGTTTTVSSTVAGGTWSTSNALIATVDINTGLVTAISSGTAIMTYTVAGTGACLGTNATGTINIDVKTAPTTGVLSAIDATLCSGATTTVSSTVAGGTWSTSNAAIAIVDINTGLVTAISTGTAIMTYTVSGTAGCLGTNATGTINIDVTSAPISGVLSAVDATLCSGTTTTVSSTVAGGTWSTSNAAIATVDINTGLVTAISTGTAIMTYTVSGTGACLGTNASGTINIDVTSAPTTGVLSAVDATLCSGTTTTVSSTVAGGTWTTSNAAIATVDLNSGLVTTISGGTAVMTYTVTGTGVCLGTDVTATTNIDVTTAPTTGVLSAVDATLCSGTTTTVSSIVAGGTWTTSNAAIATVDLNSGLVTAISAGTAVMTYKVAGTAGCLGTDATGTINIDVTAAPIAGVLSAVDATLCSGTTTTVSSTVAGGTWTTSNAAIATVDLNSGLVTAISGGTAVMTYTVSGTAGCLGTDATATINIDVTSAPDPGTLTPVGASLCLGGTTTMSSDKPGGTWSTSNAAIATIDINSGLLTAVSVGSATMTYTVVGISACTGTDLSASVNIDIIASPVSGVLSALDATICTGTTTTVSSTVLGGAWSTLDGAIATVDMNTGLVTGISSGTATMTYTVVGTGSCVGADASASIVIDVTTAPISGLLSVVDATLCSGTTTTVSSTVAGGTWSSSNAGIATVDLNTGLVTAISTGTAIMTYTVAGTAGCLGTDATATINIDVTTAPTTGILSAVDATLCSGTTTTVSSTVAGGTWTTSDAGIATVDINTGLVTAISTGTAIMTYTVVGTGGCLGTDATGTINIDVTTAPTTGILSAVDATLCSGTTTTVSSTVAGGTWSTSDAGIATVDLNTGLVTAISTGTAIMTYTVAGTGGCLGTDATATINIDVTTAPTTGVLSAVDATLCSGTTTTVSSTVLGGTWSTSNAGIATVNLNTGLVTAISTGTAIMTYTVLGTGGCLGTDATATINIDVTTAPTTGVLSAVDATLCSGTTTTVSSTVLGGTWATSNAGIATVNLNTGLVTAISSGTAIMTYTVLGTGGCLGTNVTATINIDVTTAPTTGVLSAVDATLCSGTTTTVSSTVLGGTWATSNAGIATVDLNTGLVTAISTGTAIMTYTVVGTGGCLGTDATATINIDVTTAPTTGVLSAVDATLCSGTTTTVSSTVLGGTWATSNAGIATVNLNTGLVTAISSGTAIMTYTVSGTGGCLGTNATATINIDVTTAPTTGVLSAVDATLCSGTTTTVSSTVAGGTWSSSNAGIATVNLNTGLVTAISSGTAIITYTVVGTGGCLGTDATATINIDVSNSSVPTGDAKQYFCSLPSDPTVANLVANGTSIKWYSAANGGTVYAPTSILVDNTHYFATQTNASGCESSTRLDVLVHLSSLIALEKSITKPYCGYSDGKIVVTASNGIGNYSFVWNEGTLNDTISKISKGTYSVIVTDSIGCTSKLSFEISCKLSEIPQVISANGNGKNETWVIHADPKASVEIYNRWGSLVYSALPYNDDWNGQTNVGATLGDQGLPSGTYFYMIDNKDGEKPVSGYIELIK